MILKEKITLDDLINSSNGFFADRIKFCIDRKARIVAVDEEYHIDMEHELFDETGSYDEIFGGDIMIDPVDIIWEAHPNIERNRELGVGSGRLLSDETIKEECFGILKEWIV